VKHIASPKFWAACDTLPLSIQKLADANFVLLECDPRHPSLQFKKGGRFWSVRVGLRCSHLNTIRRTDLPDGRR